MRGGAEDERAAEGRGAGRSMPRDGVGGVEGGLLAFLEVFVVGEGEALDQHVAKR